MKTLDVVMGKEDNANAKNYYLKLSSRIKNRKGYITKRRKVESKFQRLYDLPYFQEVYDRLRDGWSLSNVAKMIRERGGCLEITFWYLRALLHSFRNKKIPKSEIIQNYVPELVMNAEKKFKESIDELEEIEKIYKIQFNRIGIDYDKEQKIGKLFNNTHKEMEVCLAMLQASARLKQDLGLTRKELGTINVESKHILEAQDKYKTSEMQSVIMNPSSRRKVLMLAEKILSDSDSIEEKKIIDADAEVIPATEDTE